MKIRPFAVEEWMNAYETGARYNISIPFRPMSSSACAKKTVRHSGNSFLPVDSPTETSRELRPFGRVSAGFIKR